MFITDVVSALHICIMMTGLCLFIFLIEDADVVRTTDDESGVPHFASSDKLDREQGLFYYSNRYMQ